MSSLNFMLSSVDHEKNNLGAKLNRRQSAPLIMEA